VRVKGEKPEEISAFARVMRRNAVLVQPKVDGNLCDLCGTGGDNQSTFNISTTAMFVACAAGANIAKHGNRSITSQSGSADVLDALGMNLDLSPAEIASCIEEVGLGFMFAPHHHPAMKYVMPARKQLGVRTVFNILGPLVNPAPVKGQLMGVFDPALIGPVAEAFRLLGLERAMVVNGEPGLDELSVIGPTKVAELRDGEIRSYELDPAELGIAKADIAELRAGEPAENAELMKKILGGEASGAKRDIVALNAAGTLIIAGLYDDFAPAMEAAQRQIDSGAALAKLERLVEYSNEIHR